MKIVILLILALGAGPVNAQVASGATIQRMVADGYVLTNSRGGYDTKADDVKAAQNKDTLG
jgi:hypothetical protein